MTSEASPAATRGAAPLDKEKMAQVLVSLYRVKKRPTPEDKKLAKQIKSFQHGHDGNYDNCVICKRLFPIDALHLHHPGTDPASYALKDIESACEHCDSVENGKKGSTHAAAPSSPPSLRSREKMSASPSDQEDNITREQVLLKQSPITFQKRREWEPLVREYLWRYIPENGSKSFDVTMKEASEFSGASHQAAGKYIESACSDLGPFMHPDNDRVYRRKDWKPGKTAMSELDLKILQKIADENSAEAKAKAEELRTVLEANELMQESLKRVGEERDLLAKQAPLPASIEQIIKERDEAIQRAKAMEEMFMKSRGQSAKKDPSFIR